MTKPYNDAMKVSVVVPARNEASVIGACLDSLLNQAASPYETIVVDNGSDDHTIDVLRQYDKVIVVKEQRKGIVFARNTGFDAATGDVIARCDADCRLPGNWTTRIVETLTNSDALAVTGPAQFYDVPAWMQSKVSTVHQLLYFGGSRRMLGHETLFGSNMALTKSAWSSVRGEVCTDETLIHEDIDLAIHLSQHGTIVLDPLLSALASLRGAREPVPELLSRLRRWRTTHTSHRQAREHP